MQHGGARGGFTAPVLLGVSVQLAERGQGGEQSGGSLPPWRRYWRAGIVYTSGVRGVGNDARLQDGAALTQDGGRAEAPRFAV